MPGKIFVTVVLAFIGSQLGYAQQDFQLKAFREAMDEQVVLRNEQGRLPLQRLDTVRAVLVAATPEDLPVFADYLGRYTPLDRVTLPAWEQAEAAQAWAAALGQRYNLIILGLHAEAPAFFPQKQWEWALAATSAVTPTVAVLFHTPNEWPQVARTEGTAALLLGLPSPEGQALAAQVIFGGSVCRNRLNRDWGAGYPAGSGLELNTATRLGYAPPESVGMDRNLLRDSIAAIVEQGIAGRAYPGAQVLVAKDGKVVYHATFGHHTFQNTNPVRPTDRYDFASITKISTGLPVLMKWFGEGKINLDAPLVTLLPETKGSNKADLQLRRLLTHSARLMAWIPFWRGTLQGNSRYPWQKHWDNNRNNDQKYKPRTFQTDSSGRYPVAVTPTMWLHRRYAKIIYGSIYRSPLNAKPGYVYSDFFFYTMPRIVEQRTGIPFERYLQDTFYHRLGAYTLSFNPLRTVDAAAIIPTERDTFFRLTQLHGTVHDEGAAMLGGISGHAGLFGSANDLAKLMQLYLNHGQYGGEQLIAEMALDTFTRCQYCAEGIHRGLGFDKPFLTYNKASATYAEAASPASFGHSGYTGTFTWADPEHDLLFIFLSNRVYPTRLNRQLFDLAIRPRIHAVLYQAMRNQ